MNLANFSAERLRILPRRKFEGRDEDAEEWLTREMSEDCVAQPEIDAEYPGRCATR